MNEFIFSELAEGTKAAFTRKITLEMEDSFREISGDENPLHAKWEMGDIIVMLLLGC